MGLPDLNILDLSNNRLIGQVHQIPLHKLEMLSLRGNSLTGTIPLLGNVTRLKTLDLGQNNFRGAVPTELNQLTMLSFLNMEANALITGRIPSEFGRCTHLYYLSISYTGVRGQIPPEYSALSDLEELRLANTFVGLEIPQEVAKMTRLQHLDLSNSRFRKSIPTFLGDLSKLSE